MDFEAVLMRDHMQVNVEVFAYELRLMKQSCTGADEIAEATRDPDGDGPSNPGITAMRSGEPGTFETEIAQC